MLADFPVLIHSSQIKTPTDVQIYFCSTGEDPFREITEIIHAPCVFQMWPHGIPDDNTICGEQPAKARAAKEKIAASPLLLQEHLHRHSGQAHGKNAAKL